MKRGRKNVKRDDIVTYNEKDIGPRRIGKSTMIKVILPIQIALCYDPGPLEVGDSKV